MSVRRFIFAAVLLGVCTVGVPFAHADGGIDPPPAPTGGGGDPILDGCTNSPECPTIVLGILGTLGAGMGMKLRPFVTKRRADKQA